MAMSFFSAILSYLQPSLTLFRIKLLAHPKSPPTFAVPNGNRPTGNSDKTQIFQIKAKPTELLGWPACLTRRAPQQDLEKEISQISCKTRKAHRTFAARFNRRRLTLKSLKLKA